MPYTISAPPAVFYDPRGRPVPHDGVTPITWRLGAYVLAQREGRVLMIESVQSGRWELPGGGVAPGEALLEGTIRECWEENGCRFLATSPAPIHVAEQFFFWRGDTPYYWHSVMVVFQGTAAGEPGLGWQVDRHEVRAVRWVASADLSSRTTQPHQWRALQQAGVAR